MFDSSDFVRKIASEVRGKSFYDSEINQQAESDFKFLCGKIGYNALRNVNLLMVKQWERHLGDFAVIGHELTEGKTAKFPKEVLDSEAEEIYAAVVVYNNGNVVDIYCFKAVNFKKPGLFSMFKKTNTEYGVDVGNPTKLKQYSIGYVLKNI